MTSNSAGSDAGPPKQSIMSVRATRGWDSARDNLAVEAFYAV